MAKLAGPAMLAHLAEHTAFWPTQHLSQGRVEHTRMCAACHRYRPIYLVALRSGRVDHALPAWSAPGDPPTPHELTVSSSLQPHQRDESRLFSAPTFVSANGSEFPNAKGLRMRAPSRRRVDSPSSSVPLDRSRVHPFTSPCHHRPALPPSPPPDPACDLSSALPRFGARLRAHACSSPRSSARLPLGVADVCLVGCPLCSDGASPFVLPSIPA